MITDRPCTCGCKFEDRTKANEIPTMFYCKNCCTKSKPEFWCIGYKPIDNLEYLEWKLQQK